jgi:hypothetical protein
MILHVSVIDACSIPLARDLNVVDACARGHASAHKGRGLCLSLFIDSCLLTKSSKPAIGVGIQISMDNKPSASSIDERNISR